VIIIYAENMLILVSVCGREGRGKSYARVAAKAAQAQRPPRRVKVGLDNEDDDVFVRVDLSLRVVDEQEFKPTWSKSQRRRMRPTPQSNLFWSRPKRPDNKLPPVTTRCFRCWQHFVSLSLFMNRPEILLEVRHLTTSFATKHGEVRAVDDVSFTLQQGETLSLVVSRAAGNR
jgi:hypothetical protein